MIRKDLRGIAKTFDDQYDLLNKRGSSLGGLRLLSILMRSDSYLNINNFSN